MIWANGLTAIRHKRHGELRRQLSSDLYVALQQFSRQHGLTLGTLLQAAWGLLLSRYGREPDVLFGTMMSGRVPELPDVARMAGVLINPVPLRCQIEADDTVLPWLQQFQANLLALQAHQTTPLVQVQSWTELPTDQPLFESLLVLENYPRQRQAAQGKLTIRDYFSYERTNYPLTLRLIPDEELDVFSGARCRPPGRNGRLPHVWSLLQLIGGDGSGWGTAVSPAYLSLPCQKHSSFCSSGIHGKRTMRQLRVFIRSLSGKRRKHQRLRPYPLATSSLPMRNLTPKPTS